MSNWTHVAGIIRVDSFRFLDTSIDFDKLIGKTLDFDDIWEGTSRYKEFNQNPNEFLPLGSEGSLKMTVWDNPDKSAIAAYTVSIFGDLRDHDSADDIVNWFKHICTSGGLIIRQAVITAQNECNGERTWTYLEGVEYPDAENIKS